MLGSAPCPERTSGVSLGEDYALTYGFDAQGRFSTVDSSIGSATSTFTYAYVQGSDILAGWTSNHGTSHARTFEPNRNLITGIQNLHGTNLISSFDYTNDEIGRRTARIDTQPGSTATNDFGYNVRSELINAGMNTNLYSYLYDPIGNRQEAVVNSVTNTYLANELNQYTSVSNGIPVAPTYDDDGNMLSYGDWTYTWNGENRLILASNAQHVVEYAYDHIGRMVEKTSNGETTRYLWDGFNIVAEIKTTNQEPGTTNVTYNVWGLDLSGTMQGAGGVGGLLLVTKHEELGTTHYAPAYDANGNITEYVDAAGSIAASRTYGPFGETIATTGAASAFTHWWNTKPWDEATGFSEYEYRMYSPGLGRWLNRDPIGVAGGVNLTSFCANMPVNRKDSFGLFDFDIDWGVLGVSGHMDLELKDLKCSDASVTASVNWGAKVDAIAMRTQITSEGSVTLSWADLPESECKREWTPITAEHPPAEILDGGLGFRDHFITKFGNALTSDVSVGLSVEKEWQAFNFIGPTGVVLGYSASVEADNFKWRNDCCKCMKLSANLGVDGTAKLRPLTLGLVVVPIAALESAIAGTAAAARHALPKLASDIGNLVKGWVY